jgi:ABC-type lipoprotein release transport system permease subunit
MDQMTASAIFLCSSILISLGIIVLVAMVVAVNNILHKYWKNLGWNMFNTNYTFANEQVEPHLEQPKAK